METIVLFFGSGTALKAFRKHNDWHTVPMVSKGRYMPPALRLQNGKTVEKHII